MMTRWWKKTWRSIRERCFCLQLRQASMRLQSESCLHLPTHRLNLPIIAEGVETPEQVSMLQAADCLYSQGYYFFKPMPVENAEKLLADPTNQDYWDLRRDLMRRDRRVENPGTEKTALALQAYQIFTDNVLETSSCATRSVCCRRLWTA